MYQFSPLSGDLFQPDEIFQLDHPIKTIIEPTIIATNSSPPTLLDLGSGTIEQTRNHPYLSYNDQNLLNFSNKNNTKEYFNQIDLNNTTNSYFSQKETNFLETSCLDYLKNNRKRSSEQIINSNGFYENYEHENYSNEFGYISCGQSNEVYNYFNNGNENNQYLQNLSSDDISLEQNNLQYSIPVVNNVN